MSDHSHGPEAAIRRWGYAAEREAQRKGRASADLFPEVQAPAEFHDGDQRFTTPDADQWCRRIAGVDAWDLDVAACDESHLAPAYFTKKDDGLKQRWHGHVWANVPFSDIEPWIVKAWNEMDRGECQTIGMLLPASRTEQGWWHALVEPFRDGRRWDRLPIPAPCDLEDVAFSTHFLPGRTRFGHPGNPTGKGVGSPPFGCVLLVWRRA